QSVGGDAAQSECRGLALERKLSLTRIAVGSRVMQFGEVKRVTTPRRLRLRAGQRDRLHNERGDDSTGGHGRSPWRKKIGSSRLRRAMRRAKAASSRPSTAWTIGRAAKGKMQRESRLRMN